MKTSTMNISSLFCLKRKKRYFINQIKTLLKEKDEILSDKRINLYFFFKLTENECTL